MQALERARAEHEAALAALEQAAVTERDTAAAAAAEAEALRKLQAEADRQGEEALAALRA